MMTARTRVCADLSYNCTNRGLSRRIHDSNVVAGWRPAFIGLDGHRFKSRLCQIHDREAEARLRAAFTARLRRRQSISRVVSELSLDKSNQSGVRKRRPDPEKRSETAGSVTDKYPASDVHTLGSTATETAASVIVSHLELTGVPEEESEVLETENFLGKSDFKHVNINSDNREECTSSPMTRRPSHIHALAHLLDALESFWLSVSRKLPKPASNFMLVNFATVVKEFAPERVPSVKGEIPACLNGEFVCTGPNPKFKAKAGYHWFDGDGMLHGLRIKDGEVTYASRYVKTSRLAQEEYWGGAKFIRIGDLTGTKSLAALGLYALRLILGVLDISEGTGTANTALTYHNGTLLTMHDQDMPYAIRVLEDGDFETIARLDYDKKLNHYLTAHPKIDPDTGEMFTFGYRLDEPPYVTYRVVSKDGEMGDPVHITTSGPVLMHDFAITENYAIFMDLPLYCSIMDMILKDQFTFSFKKSKPARFGILPRYAKDESQIRWFELSTCMIFHNANAWEEGNDVVLISCRSPDVALESAISFDDNSTDEPFREFEMWEYRFNMKTGKALERSLSEFRSEFPSINDHYIGRKTQFVYTGLFQDEHHVGVAKYDLELDPSSGARKPVVGGNIADIFWYGHRRFGLEPVFVPKNPGRTGDEDDGYILSFVVDEQRLVSEVLVIDAKTMSPDPVAVIELPRRIPFAFHAKFVSEADLQLQKS